MHWDPPDPAACRWHPYPADVPVDARHECAYPGCGMKAAVVRVYAPSDGSRTPAFGDLATAITVWCEEHARGQGWDGVFDGG